MLLLYSKGHRKPFASSPSFILFGERIFPCLAQTGNRTRPSNPVFHDPLIFGNPRAGVGTPVGPKFGQAVAYIPLGVYNKP